MKKTLQKKLKPTALNCPFCREGKRLDFKDVEVLKKYLTERGKILGKDRTGLCAKHQRNLAIAVKRARFLALLPFTIRVK